MKTSKSNKELLQLSKISLYIDDYDEIFSDFDPRPYSQRSISDDFLSELKRATSDKISGELVMSFLMPKSKRKVKDEKIIKKRLREHFSRHFTVAQKEKSKIIQNGLTFSSVGIMFMFIAALILFKYSQDNFITYFLIILLEPAGWFSFWEGLNQSIFEARKLNKNLEFLKKMSKCEVYFIS